MAIALAPPMHLESLVTDLSADFAQSTDMPHEEAITVAELWGQNTSLGVNSSHPTSSILPQFGKARKHIFRSIKQTLRERQLAYIDVLQYHISDPNEPLAETMRALNDVVEAGYVRYVAVSSYYVWQLRTMRVYGITNRLTPFVSFQERADSAFLEGEPRVSPLLDAFAGRPLRPLEKSIVFESLA